MARNIRTGYQFRCLTGADDLSDVTTRKSSPIANGLPQNCWGISFEAGTTTVNVADPNNQWVYYVDNLGKIWKSTVGPYNDVVAHPYTQLNPDEVTISAKSGFYVLGAEPPPGNTQQPFINIRLVGTITFQNIVTPFSMQTSVSQRLIDI
jgi:hypothetical protein